MTDEHFLDEPLTGPEREALERSEYRHNLRALEEFRENLEDSENLLFVILAEKIRNGTLHHHRELMEYLAGACDGIATGTPPHEALGFTQRGRKKKGFGDWLRCVHEIKLARQLSDLPLDDIYSIVSEKMISFGIPLGVESAKKHYKNHKNDTPDFSRENVHEHLCWIDGHYITATGMRAIDLGEFAQEFEKELFERVKKQQV